MGVKPGCWHWWRKAGWGCLRIGCRGEYLFVRGQVTGEWRKLHKEELNDLHSLPHIVRVENWEEWDGQGMWRVWGRIEVCTGCWWGSLRERGHWGDQDVDGRIILRWIFRKLEGVVGTGWSWLRIGKGGGHLWVRWGTFGFHKCGEFLDKLQSLRVSFSRRTLLHGVSKLSLHSWKH